MKATGLMIGDLFRVNKDVVFKKGTIVVIRGIDADRTFRELKGCATCVAFGNPDNMPGGVWLDYLDPIPLTPEILEKNGFEKTQIHGEKQDDIFQCFDGEIIIEVGIYDPNFILIHYRYETPDGINSGELSSIVKVDGGKFYIHELQHALRLCGIDKEIEL